MAGLPNIQTAQYGDRAKLEELGSSRMTNNPATDVQSMKDMAGGRPAETDPVKLAERMMQQQMAQQGQQPQYTETELEHQKMFNSLGELQRTAQKWVRIASSPGAGPFTRAYAKQVLKNFHDEFVRVRAATPFFDGD